MIPKVEVEIFCGLTCYMLGNSGILSIGSYLPEKWLSSIELVVSPCSPDCQCKDLTHAPYARINGEMMYNVSLESVCSKIRSIMNSQPEE